jgi:hypothetical protein
MRVLQSVECRFRGVFGSHSVDNRYLRRGRETMLTLAQARGFADNFERVQEPEIAEGVNPMHAPIYDPAGSRAAITRSTLAASAWRSYGLTTTA